MLCSILSSAVTLHWNPFGLYWGTLVMFVFLFFPSLFRSLSSSVSWIDFPFVPECTDAQCWFQWCSGCFIARSVFVYGGIPQFPFSTQENPLRPGISHRPLLLPTSQRWTGRTSDPLPKHTNVSAYALMYAHIETHVHSLLMHTQWHTFSQTHMHSHTHIHKHTPYTTNRHFHTQYLLLFHIAVNPVKKLCGERK